MEEWYTVAILDLSCGNEAVGEMWQETKIFDSGTPVCDIMSWAAERKGNTGPENFKGKLTLTIGKK